MKCVLKLNKPNPCLMLDDTNDISEHTQQVTVFSYEVEGTVHERFWEFFNSKAHNAKGLAEGILEQLSVVLNGDSDKLIAQTYDGAAIMHSEKGANTIIKQSYQYAHFVHTMHINLISLWKGQHHRIHKLTFFSVVLLQYLCFLLSHLHD